MEKKVEIIVTGRVQGVGFRYFIEDKAVSLNLKGYVKNIDYNKVEIVAEGEETNLNQLVEFAEKGPSYARVTNIKTDFKEATGEFKGFNLRF